jgi:hypothetical protein
VDDVRFDKSPYFVFFHAAFGQDIHGVLTGSWWIHWPASLRPAERGVPPGHHETAAVVRRTDVHHFGVEQFWVPKNFGHEARAGHSQSSTLESRNGINRSSVGKRRCEFVGGQTARTGFAD